MFGIRAGLFDMTVTCAGCPTVPELIPLNETICVPESSLIAAGLLIGFKVGGSTTWTVNVIGVVRLSPVVDKSLSGPPSLTVRVMVESPVMLAAGLKVSVPVVDGDV